MKLQRKHWIIQSFEEKLGEFHKYLRFKTKNNAKHFIGDDGGIVKYLLLIDLLLSAKQTSPTAC